MKKYRYRIIVLALCICLFVVNFLLLKNYLKTKIANVNIQITALDNRIIELNKSLIVIQQELNTLISDNKQYIENSLKVDEKLNHLSHEILKNRLFTYYNNSNYHFNTFYNNNGYRDSNAYIAHGGGVKDFTYTNSFEAFEDSLNRNFKFIEIDLIETKDHKLLGAHDWKYFKNLTKSDIDNFEQLESDVIKTLRIKTYMKPLFGSDIRKFMKSNKDIILVTDKIRNYDLVLSEIPYSERLIVEVFSPNDYLRALDSGIKYPAFCIGNLESLKIAKEFKFPIVTMAAWSFFNSPENIKLVQNLHDDGVTILLYGSGQEYWNAPEWAKKYVGKTVSKIYTDYWSPNELP